MSTDATIATVGTTNTTASSTTARNPSFRCYNCNRRFRVITSRTTTNTTATTTTTNTFLCQSCHRHHVQHIPSISLPSPSSDSNPNHPSISIYGPFSFPSPRTPLHTSDYIDTDDDDLFNSVLDRIASQQQTNHPLPTSKLFIDSLPVVKITGRCSICQNEFESEEKLNQLPCKHVFHHECILPWLNRSNSCPLCRHKLPTELRARPLMKYVVRLGNLYVEGWGRDHASGFRDAVFRNGLFGVLRRQSSSTTPSTRTGRARTGRAWMRRARRGSVGPAGSEDMVSRPFVEREGRVDGANGDANALVDEDGDTLMLDA